MVDVIGNTIDQLTQEFNKQMELVLRAKLQLLSVGAYRAEEFDLHYFLVVLLNEKITLDTARQELARLGYEIEVQHPEMGITFKNGNLTATVDLSQVKVKIKKTILEG
jgi:hypothetical protein